MEERHESDCKFEKYEPRLLESAESWPMTFKQMMGSCTEHACGLGAAAFNTQFLSEFYKYVHKWMTNPLSQKS